MTFKKTNLCFSKAISLSMNSVYFTFLGSFSSFLFLYYLIVTAFLCFNRPHFTFSSLVNGPIKIRTGSTYSKPKSANCHPRKLKQFATSDYSR